MNKNRSSERTQLSMLPARLRPTTAISAVGNVGLMFFLLRMAFWLGLVLVLLPTGAHQATPTSDVKATAALSAASATVHDVRGFCTREPNACTVGSEIATAIGYRAKAGAKMLYTLLSEALAPTDGGSRAGDAPAKAVTDRPALERVPQNTLTPADLAPAWRGPPVRKDNSHSA